MKMKIIEVVEVVSLLCILYMSADAKSYHHQKREAIPNICSQSNNTHKLQCYCIEDSHELGTIRAADCYLLNDIPPKDESWDALEVLQNITKLTLSNSRGITLKYIPTRVFHHLTYLQKIDVRHGNIKKITTYDFSNSSSIEEITLRSNQIEALEINAFANHQALNTISLEKNNIVEINRNIFTNLPSLEKLYLTDNKITTIHDKAFVQLRNLKELEIDRNAIFSLNSETFSGLDNLERLELSSNSLEVIGDNTFRPLRNLQSLNLESNRIQMLDEKAFHGLSKIISLSLARNELKTIENLKIFEGLHDLKSISFKGNKMLELKKEVLEPILVNFHGLTGSLDIDENNFPCDCRLEWFAELMKTTHNKRLKMELENLKCIPDSKLKETWHKLSEVDKSETQETEDKETNGQEADYEYYDETQLDGKLFYIDVRDLLNCTPKTENRSKIQSQSDVFKTTEVFHPKPTFSTTITPSSTTTKQTTFVEETKFKVANHGTLDLSLDTSTSFVKTTQSSDNYKGNVISGIQNDIKEEPKPNMYTTSRLATVSAKPNNAYEESEMASDEAKPDKLKAQRSVDLDQNYNAASRSIGCYTILVSVFLCNCLFY